MNIPEHLSRLIASGLASFGTFTLGGSSSGAFDISDDSVVIILGMQYKHFTDVADLTESNDIWSRSVHQLAVYSEKSYNNFLIYNTIRTENFLGQDRFIPYGKTDIDCYLVHTKGQIKFEITIAPLPAIATTVDVPPAAVDSLEVPLGFGNSVLTAGVPTVTEGTAGDGTGYQPYGRKFVPSAAATNFDGYRVASTAANAPASASLLLNNAAGAYFPFINISYIRIQRQADYFTKGS